MDANKLAKLTEISYTVQTCCGLCKFGQFPTAFSDFGTCAKHQYAHLKHTDAERALSVHRCGICSSFDWSLAEVKRLGGFVSLSSFGVKE